MKNRHNILAAKSLNNIKATHIQARQYRSDAAVIRLESSLGFGVQLR